jgi:flagellin-like hook-associated protein FlgL
VRDGQVFKLLSGEWVRVGSVNTQNAVGAAINANVATGFGVSSTFNGTQGSQNLSGWSIVRDPLVPGDPSRGIIQIPTPTGTYDWAVPQDSTLPTAGQGSPTDQGFSTQLYVPSPNRFGNGDGEFRLITSNVPYGDDFTVGQVVKGPYMVTHASVPFDQGAGNTVSFRWKADSTGDTYDVSAYLVDPTTGHSIQVLNASGNTAGQDQAWNTASATIDRPGRYHLVIIGGSVDADQQAGGQTTISIDNLSHTSSVRLSQSDVSTMKSWITYTDSLGIDLGINGVNFQRTPSTPAITAAALAADIQAAIDDGRLSNLAVSVSGDSVTLVSTRPGVPFNITQASIGGDDGLSISTEELAGNQPDSGAVRGVARPTDSSIDAVTRYGGVLLSSTDGEQRFSVTVGDEGFGENSRFYRLGFHAGQFGGPTADARLTAEASRFHFQVGTSEDDTIALDIPNLAGPRSKLATTADLLNLELGLARHEQTQSTLDALQLAQTELIERRAQVGSFMNRLELQIGKLSEESLEISRQQSMTGDLDYTSEATKLATTQIRQQASTAVLAQSNVNLRKALDLLR